MKTTPLLLLLPIGMVGFLYLSTRTHSWSYTQCAGAKAQIGMSRDDLIKACGKPDHINVDLYADSDSEQWVYSTMWPVDYVYLENDHVRSMQYNR